MVPFRYPSSTLHEFVKLPKRIVGDALEFRDMRERGMGLDSGDADRQKSVSKEARIPLETRGGRAALLELIISAGRLDSIITYSASLLVDRQRIRGVDFSKIERWFQYKIRIPKGWHQNIIDPNTGENRHELVDLAVKGWRDDHWFSYRGCAGHIQW